MKPAANLRQVQTSAVQSAEFGISIDDSAHIMTILRDTLYSDKILAVIREYSSNAWDAHREVGKADLPIKVHVPVYEDPRFVVRDFGTGLSREQVFTVFTQYGRSTKRDSDEAVGMLGIGCKSGFAYADSFTITSFHGGTKSVYVAALDASEKGVLNLLCEEPCGDETGLEIEIAVDQKDLNDFHQRAQRLFKYFVPRPEVNIEIPRLPDDQLSLKSGVIFPSDDRNTYYDQGWTAVMGCVAYKVDINQLRYFEEGLPDYVFHIGGALYFDIGEVHINASREELKYSDKTKRALIDRINELVAEYVHDVLDKIEKEKLTPWAKRLHCQKLSVFRKILPEGIKGLDENYVKIRTDPKTFTLSCGRERYSHDSVPINQDVRIIVRDDGRALSGFKINLTKYGNHDFILRRGWTAAAGPDPTNQRPSVPTWPEVIKEFVQILTDNKLLGVTVLKTSEMPWTAPERGVARVNIKHKVKAFAWDDQYTGNEFNSPFSRFWTPVDREPTDADVWIEINGFKPLEDFDISVHRARDKHIADTFKLTLPPLFAYKVLEKDLNTPRKHFGTSYKDWRKKWLQGIVDDPANSDLFKVWCWRILNSVVHWSDNQILEVEAKLGTGHTITDFMWKRSKALADRRYEAFSAVDNIVRVVPLASNEAQDHLKLIQERYPIFAVPHCPLSLLRGEHLGAWVQYINALDEQRKAKENE